MARVLVVDDTPSIRFLIRTNLELAGHEVTEAEDGQACLELLATERFDAVTIDAVMPTMDGYATVEAVRRGDSSLPIVMVTTQTQAAEEQRGIDAGVTAYIVKPFDPDHLVATVESLLNDRLPNQNDTLRR